MARSGRVRKRPPVSVCIMENHPLAARRLVDVLRGEGGVQIVSAGRGCTQPTCPCSRASIIILDGEVLAASLDEFFRSLRSKSPNARILVLGTTTHAPEVCQLLLSGAKGFMPYEEVDACLAKAIRVLREGHLWARAEVLEQLASQAVALATAGRRGPGELTRTESRAVSFLKLRLSNKEIASKMGIAERTVKFHLANVFRKLGVHDRYSLVDALKGRSLAAST